MALREDERGWTREFPQADGDYLCRINEHDLSPVSFRMESGAIYEYGCGKNLRSDYHHHTREYEFLGPFTAQDLEQLVRLRDAAEVMDAAARFALMTPGLIRGRDQLLAAAEALREILDNEKEQ